MARWSLHPVTHHHAQIMLIPTAFGVNTQAPTAILNAGRDLCGFEPRLNIDVDQLAIGQLEALDDEPPFAMCEAAVSHHLKRQQWPILLPSQMAATWGAARAIWKQEPKLCVVYWSAHANLFPVPEQMLADEDPHLSSASWVERLYDAQIQVVYVGMRSSSATAWQWLQEHHSPVFWAQQEWQAHDVIQRLPACPIFLVIDANVLDPATVAAVAYPEPGGVSWQCLVTTCLELFRARPVLGVSLGGLSVTNGIRQSAQPLARLLNWLIACHAAQPPLS